MNGAVLKLYKEDEELKSLPIQNTMMIGRQDGCDLRLDDRAISREHAFLRIVEEGVEIKKKSQFGVIKVNGKDVTHAIVSSKDLIEIGPYRLKINHDNKVSLAPKEKPIENKKIEKKVSEQHAQRKTPIAPENSVKFEQPFELTQNTLESSLPPSEELALQSLKDIFEQKPDTKNSFNSDQPQVAQVPEEFSVEITPASEISKQVVNEFSNALQQSKVSSVASISVDSTKAQSLSQFVVSLKVLKGNLPASEYPMKKDRIVIGRSSRCDITLPEKKCSRENTEIYRKENKFFIKDLSSSNGTRVNGVRIDEAQLFGNENILVGDTEFKFEVLQRGFGEQQEELNQVAEQFANVIDFKTKTNINALDPLLGAGQTVLFDSKIKSGETQKIMGLGIAEEEPVNLNAIQKLRHRFRTDAKFRRLVLLAFAAFFLLFFFDEQKPVQQTTAPVKNVPQKEGEGIKANTKKLFENLSPTEKDFVVKQRDLAFEYFRNAKYDEAIFEIDKIFQYVDDYNDAKTLRIHSLEGKKRLESKEEERRIAELEKKVKEEVLQLEAKAKELLNKKDFVSLEAIFSEILSRQPENEQVPQWRKEIEDYQEQEKQRQEEMLAVEKINEKIREHLENAHKVKNSENFILAIEEYKKIIAMNAPDASLTETAQMEINVLEEKLKMLYETPLQEGKKNEEAGELALAYRKFEEAQKIDPRRTEGKEGMSRVFGALEEKAKVLYTEAIVAESLSDFAQAKKKFTETLESSPTESIYFERSQRKLARYKNFNFE